VQHAAVQLTSSGQTLPVLSVVEVPMSASMRGSVPITIRASKLSWVLVDVSVTVVGVIVAVVGGNVVVVMVEVVISIVLVVVDGSDAAWASPVKIPRPTSKA